MRGCSCGENDTAPLVADRMEIGLAKPQNRVPGATTRGLGSRRAIPNGAIAQMDAGFVGCDVGRNHGLNIDGAPWVCH